MMFDTGTWFAGESASAGTLWTWLTLTLSVLVAAGYCVIAINWYFQAKLSSRREQSRAALARLRLICLCCAVCGYVFWATDMPWIIWRIYDLVLVVFAVSTWSFVRQTSGGLRLVDERLAQVDELERSARRYREIAELLPHMVWTATAHGRVDFSNQRWREYAGEGAAGERTWIDAIHPDEQLDLLNRWNDAVQTRAAVTLEARLRDAAGAYRAFVITATPIVHGDAIKWLGACADIEDQKLLAEQKEMQARQKSFFLNALSHDLRAPLHNVLLNAQLLKMSAAARPPLAPENAATATATDMESIDMIVENAIAAGDLLAKLLDFARVGAADHNASEPVALAPLLQQVVRRFQPAAEQKGLFIRLADDASPESGAIHAQTDRHKLDRIVSNLVDNAVKYTPHGGVTLELLAPPHTDKDEHGVVLRVRDTGMGIPADNVPYLFDEFYQVNNYERDRTKGFGMGLAICRSLARHIGGEVRLAHTGPEGSCFEVLLPPAATGSIRPDRGGRSVGAAGDRGDPHPPRLCGV